MSVVYGKEMSFQEAKSVMAESSPNIADLMPNLSTPSLSLPKATIGCSCCNSYFDPCLGTERFPLVLPGVFIWLRPFLPHSFSPFLGPHTQPPLSTNDLLWWRMGPWTLGLCVSSLCLVPTDCRRELKIPQHCFFPEI